MEGSKQKHLETDLTFVLHFHPPPLPEEMYEILSNLSDTVAYNCNNCAERHPVDWRATLEKELQASVGQVLSALLNSRTSTHLLRYRQVRLSRTPFPPPPPPSFSNQPVNVSTCPALCERLA